MGRDGFKGRGNQPITFNGYSYAYQNPIMRSDPSGFDPPEKPNCDLMTPSQGGIGHAQCVAMWRAYAFTNGNYYTFGAVSRAFEDRGREYVQTAQNFWNSTGGYFTNPNAFFEQWQSNASMARGLVYMTS